eukprot:5757406-Pyramimonas_sp.AAC.1
MTGQPKGRWLHALRDDPRRFAPKNDRQLADRKGVQGLSDINYHIATTILRMVERSAPMDSDDVVPEGILHGKKDVAVPKLTRAEPPLPRAHLQGPAVTGPRLARITGRE